MSSAVVDRVAGFFESRISRRNLFVRSAFVGSALSVGGLDFVVKPESADHAGYSECCGDCAAIRSMISAAKVPLGPNELG